MENICHGILHDTMTVHGMHVLSKIVELGNWKITYENCGMIAGLSTCGLWDVANGHINRPCTFISSKYRKLGFIG